MTNDKVTINWNGEAIEVDPDQRILVTTDNGIKCAIMYMPGYDELVIINLNGHHPVWGWNGDIYRPTFTPSIMSLMKKWNGLEFVPKRNHVFVTDGKIQFLSDCSHQYAGTTKDLPRLKDWPVEFKPWEEETE